MWPAQTGSKRYDWVAMAATMRPDQVQLAQDAYVTAADLIDNYIDKLSVAPRHLLRNHVAFEIAYRIKQGVDRKQELIALAVQAALTEAALKSLRSAEPEAVSCYR